MTNKLVERLSRTLERLTKLYEELLACCNEKTDLLVASDVEALDGAQVREAMIVGKLNEMERVKSRALAEAAESVGCTSEPTISAIILALGEDEDARTRLCEIRQELKGLSRKIGSANRLNEQLCSQALSHLEVFVGLLTGRSNKQTTYTAQGKARMYQGHALMSRSA